MFNIGDLVGLMHHLQVMTVSDIEYAGSHKYYVCAWYDTLNRPCIAKYREECLYARG